MGEWNYTKDCIPINSRLKWVAVHDNHYNCNYLKRAIIRYSIKCGLMNAMMNCFTLLKTFMRGKITKNHPSLNIECKF